VQLVASQLTQLLSKTVQIIHFLVLSSPYPSKHAIQLVVSQFMQLLEKVLQEIHFLVLSSPYPSEHAIQLVESQFLQFEMLLQRSHIFNELRINPF
jgi:hypothetical protein